MIDKIEKRKAEAVDFHVGERIKIRRRFIGLSQKDIAAKLDVSYQQFQKYERGLNRLSAGKLYKIAGLMRVPINWFFEGLPDPSEIYGQKITLDDQFPRLQDIHNKEVQNSIRELIDAIATSKESNSIS
ncbi:helix-turn-helix transcriptional regulator [Temperatibacter marinus]|uniref:Helix-turn-helix transcriptional regulator n=1 Tax=Temperatibacter marinus TaxID=1456591 RepID=A0AA52HAQ2_9PROT|nr:helix-turn-helix transcriptional regulator [Temperatibacter marinus]WND02843.1 helix-turn-helix transcriptional regulator [Temperatibacter marinus]